MLRIPMVQPATDASTMVAAGRMAWSSTFEMKGQSRPGFKVAVAYPEFCGNQPSLVANSATAKIATEKYGAAWKKVMAGSRPSIQLPRRCAAAPEPAPDGGRGGWPRHIKVTSAAVVTGHVTTE